MEHSDIPLLEFDDDRRAFVNPGWTITDPVDAPTAAVACFLPRTVAAKASAGTVVARLTGAAADRHPPAAPQDAAVAACR